MNVRYVRPLEVKIDPDPSACLIIIRRGSKSTKGRRTTWGTYLLDDYMELGDDVVVTPSELTR